MFDSIAAFLKTASQRQPLVLVLDDLHWADQPSLMLLQFVARELAGARLLLIGTYRDVELSRQHPLAEALGELTRERLFQRVLLRGLSQEDVGRFIEMTSGNSAPQGLVEAVHSQTEGNPLFVTEVVRLLVQEGELNAEKARETDSWTIRIPEGVREVIGMRLNRLSQRCNEALTVASILGREFTMSQLSPLVEEVTEDRLFEILEEALAARVIEELPQSVGRYQFTHALIQETLTAELSLTRRVRLHGRIAEALEDLYGADAEAHAAELAHHFVEAEAVLGSEKLVLYSRLAGERALASYAHEEAAVRFQRALDAKERQPPSTSSGQGMDAETAALLFGLGRAQLATLERDQLAEAVTSLSRAFGYYHSAGDADQAVAVAEYPVPFASSRLLNDMASQLIPRALALVSPDSHAAGRLLSRYVRHLGIEEGNYDGARDAFDKALAIAQREQDVRLEMETLANAAQVDLFHLRNQESSEKILRAADLISRADDPRTEVAVHFYAVWILRTVGDLDGMRRHGAAGLAVAERLRDRFWLGRLLGVNILDAQRTGDWEGARDLSNRALEATPLDILILGPRAQLEYEVGNFDSGKEFLERAEESIALTVPRASDQLYRAFGIALIARITGLSDRLDVAEAAAEAVLASPEGATLRWAMSARATLGLVAVVRGDGTAAEELYNTLVSSLDGPPEVLISFQRLLGLLSQTMGNLAQAMAHFEDALASCRKGGYRPELAWTCCDYADLLRESNNEGDQAKAMSLLDESLAISSELGMRPLMERVLSRREILGA